VIHPIETLGDFWSQRIPQALPGPKMSSAGADWQTDAATQIRWGLGYIQGTYGSPCGAWAHEEADGWY
jgi:resuscitation-promoting factor RpfB